MLQGDARPRDRCDQRADGLGGSDAAGGWDLVAAAQRGDRDAFGQLYDRHVAGVSRFVGRRVHDRGLVEDLTSETFTRAWRRIGSVSDQGRDVAAWFTTIARNLVADHYRSPRHKLDRPVAEVTDAHSPQPGPERAVIDRETATELHAHLAALPTDQRDCLRLRYLEDLSVAQTATAMGRNPGAVTALTHRGITRLRQRLTDRDRHER
ncbi:MAG: RNA polymerase sigma factor [Pseudonocardiaceae bacterium]